MPKTEPEAGIQLRCVACRQTRVLSFEAAAHIDADAVPTCDNCYMPMVVESATIRSPRRRTHGT
jgi:hypothetical protein